MTSLKPMAYPIPGDPDGAYELNPTMVVELMKKYAPENDNARVFMKQYHAAEAQIANQHPYLSEEKIRGEAMITAVDAIGMRYTCR